MTKLAASVRRGSAGRRRQTALIVDTFTRANGNLVGSVTEVGAKPWVPITTGDGFQGVFGYGQPSPVINANRVTTNGNSTSVLVDPGITNYKMSMHMVDPPDLNVGSIVMLVRVNHNRELAYLYIQTKLSGIQLAMTRSRWHAPSNGWATEALGNVSALPIAPAILSIRVDGDLWWVLRRLPGELEAADVILMSGSGVGASVFSPVPTKCGFMLDNPNQAIDDFRVDALAA